MVVSPVESRMLEDRIRRPNHGVMITPSSPSKLCLADAVRYTSNKSTILQSAREAAALRVLTLNNGFDYSGEDQATRTAILYFKVGDKYFFAIDDEPDETNIVLSRTQEGFDFCDVKGVWFLPIGDGHVKKILKRAESRERLGEIRIPNIESNSLYITGFARTSLQPNYVDLSLKADNSGRCSFTMDSLIQSALGDYTEHYADLLRSTRHHVARLRVYPRSEYPGSKGLLMDGFEEAMARCVGNRIKDYVQVRAIFLSKGNGIYARANFCDSLGYARGLVNVEPN